VTLRDPSLDGLRGIAALWVFATHATYGGLLPPVLNFRGAGRGGVILFFFLSAFLLSGPFFRRLERALSWREWAAYWVRRVCRIVPLYYGVVLLFFALGLFPFDERTTPSVALRHLTFQRGMGVFWTIVVEVRLYVVLPILMMAIAFIIGRIRMGRLLVCLVGSAWMAGAAMGVLGSGFLLKLGMDKHAPVFVTGVFAALAVNELSTRRLGRDAKIGLECLGWLSAIAFVCLSVPAVYRAISTGAPIAAYSADSRVYEAFWDARISWIGLILGALFVSLSTGSGLLRRVVAWSPLRWVGRIGFGVYLIHVDVLHGFGRTGLPPFVQLLLGGLTTLALADLLHRLIEAPGIAAGRRIASGFLEGRGDDQRRTAPSVLVSRGPGSIG
jgi:peptidoglycan/LPS O-acetylase OafA/YrhL